MAKDINDVWVIDNVNIGLGETANVKINVGKLPSGTRINLMAHVYRSLKPGPCLLVLGGVHGDEINGIEIVRSAIEDNFFEKLNCGSVIAIPLLNVYGFINFSREVPDGKDVNRSFPGSTSGSLASRVARTLTKKILPSVTYGIDFHTGGASRYNYPQIRYSKTDSKAKELAEAFAPPVLLEKPLISKSLRKAAKDMKIPVIVYEGGESIRLDGFSIQKGRDGMQRVMKHLGMLDKAPSISHSQHFFKKSIWLRASHSGMFTWTRTSGSFVQKGEPVGLIKDPFGEKSITVLSSRSGYIIGHNNASVVNQGDALFHVGYEETK